ncbi:MAG: ABC transporter permease [Bryobacterales bacterium]|nr:ABC transporter permease [Bryobacteraceae bacterium]MDW8131443.1 ABC transporter permease [Bryobacterales bacterium]
MQYQLLALRDNFKEAGQALAAHRLRVALTVLGIMMGVATLITVMTLIQGANVYVEEKIANLGTNVFQISRLPFAVTDFNTFLKALRNRHLTLEDMRAIAQRCPDCRAVGAQAQTTRASRYRDRELEDTVIIGQTASMADIDTRTIVEGRYFTAAEDERGAGVCLVGARLVEEFFPGLDPLGRTIRVGKQEFTVIGVYEKIGAILGQEQDNFAVVPMGAFQRLRGGRFSVTISVKATAGGAAFERAQDQARMVLRARRQITGNREEDFFIGTAESYIELWRSISSAFFATFVLVSSIAAVVGGIVIMNVMLVSVTQRTKEIGVRRAVGASQQDIFRQFLTESVLQCVAGGALGVGAGFLCALALRNWTSFPAAVQTWVALLGLTLSSAIGLFFGIYPAVRAARLDPVAALRSE